MPQPFQVTFDSADPPSLAAFWATALGYELQGPPPGFPSWDAFGDAIGIPPERRRDIAAIVDPTGAAPRVLFQRVPEPKVVKNRVHLDISAGAASEDPAERWAATRARADELVAAGATEVEERSDWGARWLVMLDPEGNEFCV